MDAIAVVKEFIVETFLFGDAEKLKENASLVRERIVDSTGMLELVAFLEERFDMVIDDEELVPENLDTLRDIERFLGRKLGAGSTVVSPPGCPGSRIVDCASEEAANRVERGGR
jgi:acyl carrier protein